MPIMFQFMDTAIAEQQQEQQQQKQFGNRAGLTKIFYAIETFGAQLGAGLLPYLDPLMEKLFLLLSVTNVRMISEVPHPCSHRQSRNGDLDDIWNGEWNYGKGIKSLDSSQYLFTWSSTFWVFFINWYMYILFNVYPRIFMFKSWWSVDLVLQV